MTVPAEHANVGPGGLEALTRESSETPYRSISLLAVSAFMGAAAYCFFVALGGIVAFWHDAPSVLYLGTILVPILSVLLARKLAIRGRLGLARFAALALAGFYAIPVGIGGLIAFPGHPPWLLPPWTLAIPLLATGCGWVARLRIQASEDTLSGKPFATWAVGLSLFFALSYTAYYTATYIAVRQQAEQCANDWIERLQKDDVERAFVLTISPWNRARDGFVQRDVLELNFNSRRGPELGQYSLFGQQPYVRLLRGTSQPNVELLTDHDWGFEEGGYKVSLSYRVRTPYWTFPLEITVHGVESPNGAYKGRRWYVQPGRTFVRAGELTFTPEGKAVLALMASCRAFAEDWIWKLYRNKFLALEDTLPAAERAAARSWRTFGTAGGPGVRAVQQKETAFFRGNLVRSDDKLFWAPKGVREEIVARVQGMFAADGVQPEAFGIQRLPPQMTQWPSWTEENGRMVFRQDVDIQLQLPSKDGAAKKETVIIEGRLLVSCPSTDLPSPKPEWRIESLELLHGRRQELPR